jgi:hypothetical protein
VAQPYSQISFGDFISQISDLMDDQSQRYWTVQEITFAIQEALQYWAATTRYWRQRAAFTANPSPVLWAGSAQFINWFDLSQQFPALRSRAITLDQVVREIQFMLQEAANGLSGSGMSQQISVTSIVRAILQARDRFVLDTRLPILDTSALDDAGEDGVYALNQDIVFLHRIVWQDIGGAFTVLWRQDAWAADRGLTLWPTTPAVPYAYSEAESAPLVVQLIPPPIRGGRVWSYSVPSIFAGNAAPVPSVTLGLPDEWVHAVKYGALAKLLSASSQANDPERAEYCAQRYKQSVELAKGAASIVRVLVNNVPLPLDTITNIDLGYPNWMNAYGPPFAGAALYDILALAPGQLDNSYGVAVDVVRSAPLPQNMADFMPLGEEDLDPVKAYACHILAFKDGGKEFTSTMSGYDQFMGRVQARTDINRAKIQYLEPLFNQPHKEWAQRPDRLALAPQVLAAQAQAG